MEHSIERLLMALYEGEYADTADGAIRLFVFLDVTGWTFRAYSLREHRWLLGQQHASSLKEGKDIAEQWAWGIEHITAAHALRWRRNNELLQKHDYSGSLL